MLEGLVEVFYFSGNSWQLDAPRYNSSSRAFLSPQTWAYDNCFRWRQMADHCHGAADTAARSLTHIHVICLILVSL